ncbi:MAG: hypothetical protein C4523_03330 [Myxococcales bacterium]|nr:MAG: hypothetical protein C4523_03330 [Myxococcales bacterium]
MKRGCLAAAAILALLVLACGETNGGAESQNSDGDGESDGLDGDAPDGDRSDGDAEPDAEPDAQPDGDEEQEVAPFVPYVIVAADSLAEAAADYADYRSGTGYAVESFAISDLTDDADDSASLLNAVQGLVETAQANNPSERPVFLLLIGDALPPWEAQTAEQVPVIDCYSSTGDCYTDNTYGDLDDDRIPDAVVGRLPARTPEQVRAYLSKVQTHESSYETGLWNRRFMLWAGEAGFGEQIDGMIEMVTFMALEELNHAFDVFGVYGNPASAYYYTPIEPKIVELFNQGNLFSVYIGHGSTDGTDGLEAENLAAVHCGHRLPFSFFFACGNGDFASDMDSIAEAIIWKTDGALVSFAGSSTTHPYGNAILPYELQRAILDAQPPTIGEAVFIAKHQAIENDDDIRRIVDNGAETSGVPREEQEMLRYEHLDLYNLLGDPATALNLPRGRIVFEPGVTEGSVADGVFTVEGVAPDVSEGTAFVTLEVKRTVMLHELEEVDPYAPDEATVQRNWEKAVDKVLVGAEVPVDAGGAFSARLEIPEEFRSFSARSCYIKVYAHDGVHDAIGSMDAP